MATFTYWRLHITADQRVSGSGNFYCNIAEFVLLDSLGVAIDNTGAVWTSSGYFTTYTAAMAGDLNASTCWSGNTNVLPAYLQVQLAAPADARSFRLQAYTDTNTCVKDAELWGSDDGLVWTALGSISGETGWTVGQIRTYLFDSGLPTAIQVRQLVRETLRDGGSPLVYVRQMMRETLRSGASGATGVVVRQMTRETLRSGAVGVTGVIVRGLVREVLRSNMPASTRRRVSLM